MAYVTLPTQTSADLDSAANINQLMENIGLVAAAAGATVRQTVLFGSVDGTTNLPNAMTASAGLVCVLQASSTTAMTVSFATGWGAQGAENKIGYLESNLTYTALAASNTSYLYVERESAGTMTSGHTIIAPEYSYTAPSTTAGQHWYDLAATRMKMYSTSAWVNKTRVFVGEVVTTGTAVSSITTYAYQGLFYGESSTPAGGTNISFLHKIGTNKISAKIMALCISAELNYSIGDIAEISSDGTAAVNIPMPTGITRVSCIWRSPATAGLVIDLASNYAVIDTSKWKLLCTARRDF